MDSWSNDQLKKMQIGGNGKVNAFLQQYGISKDTDIKVKYNSRAAELYREKIKAEMEGRQFVPPPPSAVPPPTSSSGSNGAVQSRSNANGRGASDDWDSWGEAPAANRPGSGPGRSNNGEYTRAQYDASAASKESFFARKMAENSSRPEHLAPSQGGKYTGFGSTPPPSNSSHQHAGQGAGSQPVSYFLFQTLFAPRYVP